MRLIRNIFLLVILAIIVGGVYIWKTNDWNSPKPTSAFLIHTYISNPGFVTADYRAEFEKTKKSCIGYSKVLNAEAAAVDAPELSLCIGILK